MKKPLGLTLLVISMLLTGCASTIRSDVTVFHAWPAELADKSFVFEDEKSRDSDLEYQSYRQLLHTQLQRLGFTDAATPKAAALRVGFDYDVKVRDVRVIQPVWVDPFLYGGGFYTPRLHRSGSFYDPFYSPFGGPFYDPFWYGPSVVTYQQSDYQLYRRQLHVGIRQAKDGKKLYEVTVVSEGRSPMASVMPYMLRSAFADFPGKSGVARRVALPISD